MYVRVNEGVGGYGDYSEEIGYRPSLGMAVALPAVGLGAAIVALLEALAFVATAMAAAWLLVKAYERAKSLGFGVDAIAPRLVSAMGAVVAAANRVINEIERLLREAARQQQPPDCERFLQFMRERLGRIRDALRRFIAIPTAIHSPQFSAKTEALKILDDSLEGIGPMIQLMRQCIRL